MDEFNTFIDDLKQRASIADVIGGYAELNRKGAYLWASCPLHVEKTASLCIYPHENSFYCYGCHKGGDVFKFIQDIERTDFMGAVEFLANKYNLEIPKFKNNNIAKDQKKKRDRLYELTRETAFHYHQNLMSQKGAIAREYLQNRGISAETIKTFGLGYSIDSTEMVKHLRSKGFTDEEMQQAQVAYIGKTTYDPQAERLVIPVLNCNKNVVAYCGRLLVKATHDVKQKYYNTMNSLIFNKSKELFGQNIVKEERKINDIILVEGHMDVISLYQAGIHNAVASMGTALTEDQARTIKRFVDKVYFMYDGDKAGQEGMERGVDILKNVGLHVYCVTLPDNTDPDEYIKQHGAEAMKKFIYQTAIPMYDFKIRNVKKKYNLNTTEDIGKFAVEAIDILKEIPTRVQVEPFLTLISKETGIKNSTLAEQWENAKEGIKVNIRVQSNEHASINDPYYKALRYIIFCIYGGVEGLKVEDEYLECCNNDDFKELYNEFRLKGSELTLDDLSENINQNSEVQLILNEGNKIKDREKAKKYFQDCRKRVLNASLLKRRDDLTKALQDEKDESVRIQLVTQLSQVMQSIKGI